MTKKLSEDIQRRFSDGFDRQLNGVLENAKLASAATYSDNWKEVLAWLQNVQSCLTQATEIACELRDGT